MHISLFQLILDRWRLRSLSKIEICSNSYTIWRLGSLLLIKVCSHSRWPYVLQLLKCPLNRTLLLLAWSFKSISLKLILIHIPLSLLPSSLLLLRVPWLLLIEMVEINCQFRFIRLVRCPHLSHLFEIKTIEKWVLLDLSGICQSILWLGYQFLNEICANR